MFHGAADASRRTGVGQLRGALGAGALGLTAPRYIKTGIFCDLGRPRASQRVNYPRSDIPAVSRAVASRAVSTRPMVLEIDEQPTRGRSHRLQRIDDRASNRESHDSAMRIDDELRTALAKELCSLTKGWT